MKDSFEERINAAIFDPRFYERPTNMNKPKIVCLCGSTRFYEEFQKTNYEETMGGRIVLSVGFFPHAQREVHGEEIGCTVEQKKALDELHLRKIDLANEILVINKDGYVGESTSNEIRYAKQIGKKIRWRFPHLIPANFDPINDEGSPSTEYSPADDPSDDPYAGGVSSYDWNSLGKRR